MSNSWRCLRRQRFEQGPYAIVPVQPAHIESIRRWRNAQMDVLRQSAPISVDQQREYFAQHIWPSMARKDPANVLMGFLLENELIGYGGLVHISWDNCRAELSFLLDNQRIADPDSYARDFTAFLALARQMAFDDLGLHRLFTETYAIRHQHIAVLEAAGFRREGSLREHIRIKGAFVDSLIHGLLRD